MTDSESKYEKPFETQSDDVMVVLPPIIPGGFFIAEDNSDPPQLWIWRGEPGDESAEPWQRIQATSDAIRELRTKLMACEITEDEYIQRLKAWCKR